MAEGVALTENSHTRKAVVDGLETVYVLHRVSARRCTLMVFKKKKKKNDSGGLVRASLQLLSTTIQQLSDRGTVEWKRFSLVRRIPPTGML
jgi:hypothetical protein